MTIFLEKFPVFTPKILMTFFGHRPGLSDFPFVFPDSPYLFSVKRRISPFLHKKKHCFRKELLDDTFFYSARAFARIRQHYFSKYWGDVCMGRSPTSPPLGGQNPYI